VGIETSIASQKIQHVSNTTSPQFGAKVPENPSAWLLVLFALSSGSRLQKFAMWLQIKLSLWNNTVLQPNLNDGPYA